MLDGMAANALWTVATFAALYFLVGMVRCHHLSYLARKLTTHEVGPWRGFWVNTGRTSRYALTWPWDTL